jgi:hypothetical protein
MFDVDDEEEEDEEALYVFWLFMDVRMLFRSVTRVLALVLRPEVSWVIFKSMAVELVPVRVSVTPGITPVTVFEAEVML